jgi:LEA14-like dessication related protein
MRVIILIVCTLVLFLSGCKIYDKMPRVGLGGFPEIKAMQADVQQSQLSLAFNMPVNFHNPFNKQIVIPPHKFNVYVDGKAIPLQMQQVSGFTIPASTDYKHPYPFILTLSKNGPLKDMLGKDSELEFKIDMDIDLAQTGIKLPKILGQEIIKKYPLSFSFKDTIRLPLMPQVMPSNQFAQIQFTGQMETFDLTAIKNGLTPMVDVMLNAKFDNSYISSAANAVLNAKVSVYSPTLTNPFRTVEVNLADHIVGLFGDDMKEKWNTLKTQLNPGQINIMDYTVNSLIKPINNNAPTHYNNFKTNWSSFKQKPLSFTYPGSQVTGLQIVVPFILKNPNKFPIELPMYSGEAKLGINEPFSVEIKPKSASSNMVAADQSVNMEIVINLNWDQGGQGVLNLINGNDITPAFSGKLKVDLGYGPVPVQYNFPLQMKLGN